MKEWFHGCLEVREVGGGMMPLRFTDAQIDFFKGRPHLFRCYNAAGIRLDVVTDSPFIRMRYRVTLKPGTTERLHFDLFIDDEPAGSPGETFTGEGAGEWTAELPIRAGSPRRVTVWLPYLASVAVDELAFADGAVCRPGEPHARNLLCFGDSITQGMNAARSSETYAALIARRLRMNLLNQAISGFVFHPDKIDPDLPYRPDLVTVAYGTNDWTVCKSHGQFERQADGFIGKLAGLYPDVPIAVLSPLWRSDMGGARPSGAFTDIHRTLEAICDSRRNVHYIDGLTLVPHRDEYFADGLHPNDRGFHHMADRLAERLPAILAPEPAPGDKSLAREVP
ncbi:SGNH/GDSL hydrolase family protein [Paenibacillus cisolokensis]|uniref:SGNH/GDSL hydrolase family protein n=1 Tax=Paenibacillus cisolokensis TaxID=1658519 RepID=UPI003D2B930B